MIVPWDIKTVELVVTKHFALGWMRDWGWDVPSLRDAISQAYRVDQVGTEKFEIYIRKHPQRRLSKGYHCLLRR